MALIGKILVAHMAISKILVAHMAISFAPFVKRGYSLAIS